MEAHLPASEADIKLHGLLHLAFDVLPAYGACPCRGGGLRFLGVLGFGADGSPTPEAIIASDSLGVLCLARGRPSAAVCLLRRKMAASAQRVVGGVTTACSAATPPPR